MTCPKQCSEHATSITPGMLRAMHERTYGLTYVKLVPLRGKVLDLRFRDTPKKRPVFVAAEWPVATLRARLEATT